ncbi:hypothetical protein SPFM14_00015 [Salmonella phage SPFM14]|nr:hypothetical protein SPFM5_00017 [Salmonella phage SPFM5]VFR13350.1 hypothetical protein SPFM14_00015 [Salmonella phage SPFM14]
MVYTNEDHSDNVKVTLTRTTMKELIEGLSKALSSDNINMVVYSRMTSHRWRTTHRLKVESEEKRLEEIKEESSTLTPVRRDDRFGEFVRNPDALLSFVAEGLVDACRDPFTLWVLCGSLKNHESYKSFDCVGRNKMKNVLVTATNTLRRLRAEQLI